MFARCENAENLNGFKHETKRALQHCFNIIGVIARDVTDPYHVQVLRGVNAAARARDYRLFLGHVDYRPDIAAIYGSMFEQSHADGILIMGDIHGGDATLDDIADRQGYVVGVSDRFDRRRVPGVYVDNERGTILALEHLSGLGHESIICVSDERTADGPYRARVYERYMADHGLSDRARVYFTTQPDPEPSYRLGRELFGHFDRPNRPTARTAGRTTWARETASADHRDSRRARRWPPTTAPTAWRASD